LLDEASGEKHPLKQIMQVSDIKLLFEKIPQIYYEDLKSNLTTIKDIENSAWAGEAGFQKSEIAARGRAGNEIKIPVYRLSGAKYLALVSTVDSSLNSVDDMFIRKPGATFTENWFETEHGLSTISCSTSSHVAKSSLETSQSHSTTKWQVTFMFGRDVDIVAMGDSDIYTTARMMEPDVFTCSDTNFLLTDDLEYKSTKHLYNEIAIERFSADLTRKGGRIIPEAIFKEGYFVDDRIVEIAVEMSEYLVAHGLKPEGYVMPIVVVNQQSYNFNDNEELREEYDRKKSMSTDIDALIVEKESDVCLSNPTKPVETILDELGDIVNS
jgi:hypothetical protein